MNDLSKTGIKERCLFNNVESFNVTENYFVDIMHDLFEGVCKYVMGNILYHLIFVEKIFTVEAFNSKIQNFDFKFESKNKPPVLSSEDIRNKKIKMSASEMICFCRYICIICGDLIPVGNEVWSLYLLLKQIISIITSTNMNSPKIIELTKLIQDHHELYLRLFPDSNLTPKFHFMLHWPNIIEKTGPPVLLWSMRYESKHREMKSSANVVSSRINISKTLAIKNQLKLCERFMSNRGFEPKIITGKSFECSTLDDLDFDDIYRCLLSSKGYETQLTVTNSISILNTKYKTGDVIIISYEDKIPSFGIIQNIVVNSKKDICFGYKIATVTCYDKHLASFELNILNEFGCINQSDLDYVSPVLYARINNRFYATLRYCYI